MKIMRKEIDQSPSFTRLRAVKSYDNHHHEFNSCTAHCNDDPNQFSGTSSTMAVRNTHLQLVGMVRVPRIETPPHASLLITKAGDARARFYCPIPLVVVVVVVVLTPAAACAVRRHWAGLNPFC